MSGGPRKQTVYQIGTAIPLGRQIVRLDYIHANMAGGATGSGFANDDDADQLAAGYEYQLSKRTSLYAVAVALRNRGGSKLAVATGNAGMKAGETSRAFDLGLRHSF